MRVYKLKTLFTTGKNTVGTALQGCPGPLFQGSAPIFFYFRRSGPGPGFEVPVRSGPGPKNLGTFNRALYFFDK